MIINPGLRRRIGGGRSFILTQLAGLGYAAAGAWSVSRGMRQAYVGALLRVRRSSDNAEQDIGFRSDGALDSAALLAFCAGGNGFASKVYDQSGGGYDMVQATAGSQPRIVSSGTLDTMGVAARPTMNFTGATKKLENAAYAHGSAAALNIVAVADGSGYAGVAGNPTANNGRTRVLGRGTAIMGASTPEIGTVTASGTMIVTASASGAGTATIKHRLNGAETASSTTTRGAPSAGIALGAGVYGNAGDFVGKLSEVVVWQSVPTDAALLLLERDQGLFYGITTA